MKRTSYFTKAALTLLVALFSLTEARAGYDYGFEDNNLSADGWATLNESTANASEFGINSAAAQTGTYGFRFSSYSRDNTSYNQYLISPELAPTGGTVQFSYKASSTYGTETFRVGYSTTDTDPSSFTFGDEISTNSTTWTLSDEFTFPAGTKYVAIYYYSDYQYHLFLDDFSFSTSLYEPVNLAASQVTATSANISWDADADSYNLKYKRLSFFEGFENVTDNNLPEGWTSIDNDGDGNNWFSASVGALSGSNCATSASYQSEALTPDNWLVTPKVALDGTMSVWLRAQDPSWPAEHFAIYLSTTGTDVSNFTTTLVPETTATGEYVEYTADLSAYAGQQGYIAIRHFNCTDMFRLNVDDFCIGDNSWTTVNGVTNPYTIEGLIPETSYKVEVQAVYAGGESEWVGINFTTTSTTAVPTDLAVTDVKATSATLDWAGSQESYTLRYKHEIEADPSAPATIILTTDDVWGDGSGYQMLLDADATAYGNEISTSGAYTAGNYSAFEYTLPEGAECDMNATNYVCGSSVTLEIPAGTYDWCITNPTPGDRIWIASSNGNVGGRADDYVFEAGKTYEFHVYLNSSGNDATDVTITRPMSDWVEVENVTTPYELTSLTPETYYEWQVQGNLTEGTTDWSEISYFTTLEAAASVTIGATGYTTFVAPSDVSFPSDVTAYIVTDMNETAVIIEPVEAIPAGTAVIVKGEEGTYYLDAATSTDDVDSNLLKACTVAFNPSAENTIYCLAKKNNIVGFYPVATSVTIPVGKAYLERTDGTHTPVKGFYGFGEDEDDPTGISNLYVNDNLNNAIYNLAGQRLGKTQKGINIVNGKKILK